MLKRLHAALVLAVVLFSVIAGTQLANLATANPIVYLPYIIIRSDGSVEPETEFIKQAGNVYTLTDNISQEYAIKIQRSNIIFDGAGHTINGSFRSYPLGYANKGLSLEGVTNVIVKDLEVSGFIDCDISIENSSECVILRVKARVFYLRQSDFNTITESNIGSTYLYMRYSNNNVIMRNNISLDDLDFCNSNTFFANNVRRIGRYFIDEANFWDNGVEGNYWSDYEDRYPNATELDDSGIWNTPYVINKNNQDNYPLMEPVVIPQQSESFPTTWIVTAIVIIAIGVAIILGVVFYRKRRKD